MRGEGGEGGVERGDENAGRMEFPAWSDPSPTPSRSTRHGHYLTKKAHLQ